MTVTDPALNHAPGAEIAAKLGLPALAADLERVEKQLLETVEQPGYGDRLPGILGHLARAGGKRIRPALTLCSYYAAQDVERSSYANDRAIDAAVAVELLHLGSLYHDDVIDEAATRRGVPSANAHWGNVVAILAGDALLAESAATSAALGAVEASVMAATLRELCIGELLETLDAFSPNRTEADYLITIAGKTAALMATSAEMGALQTPAPDDVRGALRVFGFELGLTFQIVDDILDLTANTAVLGKPVGHDLVEGVYNLPVIYALRLDPGLRSELRHDLHDDATASIRQRVIDAQGVSAAMDAAAVHLDAARRSLASVRARLWPPGAEALERLADLVAASTSLGDPRDCKERAHDA